MEVITMDDAAIRFPVKCPCCGQESLVASIFDTIVNLLETERRLKLTSECAYHRVTWVANEIERDQIQEYAAALCIGRTGHWVPFSPRDNKSAARRRRNLPEDHVSSGYGLV
jgi:hypothetical protein